MKRIFLVALLLVALWPAIFAQHQYETLKDSDGTPILKGLITRDLLTQDTAFRWYARNHKAYAGNDAPALARHKDSIQLVIFLGTWCEDSQVIIPRLFPFLDAAGFSKDRITLVGVDRSKKSLSHLTEAFQIVNVPTIIVMKDGRETGRIVEYGRYGMVEKELSEIAAK